MVYETGEVLDSDSTFQQRRNYMYLKAGEVYTWDPEFDMEGMACLSPPHRPVPSKYSYMSKE